MKKKKNVSIRLWGKAGRNRVRENEIEIKLGQSVRPLPALLGWIRSVAIIINYTRPVQASIVCGG